MTPQAAFPPARSFLTSEGQLVYTGADARLPQWTRLHSGTIRMHQERRFPGRVSGTELTSPDFVGLAQSFGAYAERVETTEAFVPALERALAARGSAVLELRKDPNQITPDRRISS